MLSKSFTQLVLLACSMISLSRATNLGGEAVVDVSKLGKIPNGQAGGILYGIPNDPAFSPDQAPTIPSDLQQGSGFTHVRAGGAQIPFAGYSSSVSGYEERFASTLANYNSARAQGANFVLLPHDLWGADATTSSTTKYPCDNGDCTFYGEFLDRLTSDLKSNNMLEALSIDLWNEPNGSNFWPGSQDQYLQAWSYAFKKYRDAFGTSVLLQGPATSGPPSLSWDWWTNYANYLSNNRDVIPDVWSYHQLEGRYAANCGNDPVDSRNNLTAVLNQYNLPNDRQVQVNEYGNNDGEQTPAYTSWFLSRFERANSTALRANWGSGRGLHDDLARLLLPNNDGLNGWTAMGDWHVLNYYNKLQSSGRVVQTQSTKSTCYDSFATLDADNRIIRILAGSRGQSGDYPITINELNSLGISSVNAVVKEIPFNNAGTVDSPNQISNGPISVDSNGSITINLNMNEDSAYTIDLTY